MKDAFASKKFLATVLGAVVVALGSVFGLSEDQTAKVAGMVGAYILGQGLADQGKEKAKQEAKLAQELNGKSAAERAAALEAEA